MMTIDQINDLLDRLNISKRVQFGDNVDSEFYYILDALISRVVRLEQEVAVG